eukprot:1229210-Rhodomonas_salina.3
MSKAQSQPQKMMPAVRDATSLDKTSATSRSKVLVLNASYEPIAIVSACRSVTFRPPCMFEIIWLTRLGGQSIKGQKKKERENISDLRLLQRENLSSMCAIPAEQAKQLKQQYKHRQEERLSRCLCEQSSCAAVERESFARCPQRTPMDFVRR